MLPTTLHTSLTLFFKRLCVRRVVLQSVDLFAPPLGTLHLNVRTLGTARAGNLHDHVPVPIRLPALSPDRLHTPIYFWSTHRQEGLRPQRR